MADMAGYGMAYKVKIDIFEGPFDLLVFLIENAEMSIYDIKVSEITSQYVHYLEVMQEYNIEVASEFMVLAATLIELKSKMLLPRPKAEGDQTLAEDPRNELIQKLLEYKKFRMAAEGLERQEELAMMIHTKPQEDLGQYTKEPDEYIDLDLTQFVKAFNLFIMKKKKIEDIHKRYDRIEREKITVEETMRKIKGRFGTKAKLCFSDLFEEDADRYEIVLTFVSVLELIRQKIVNVRQNANFGEIYLTLKTKNNAGGETEE
jgi:segregation and condensation protein A